MTNDTEEGTRKRKNSIDEGGELKERKTKHKEHTGEKKKKRKEGGDATKKHRKKKAPTEKSETEEKIELEELPIEETKKELVVEDHQKLPTTPNTANRTLLPIQRPPEPEEKKKDKKGFLGLFSKKKKEQPAMEIGGVISFSHEGHAGFDKDKGGLQVFSSLLLLTILL